MIPILLGFKTQGQYFFKKAMSVCCLVAGAASGNSSQCSTGSEMGSRKPLASYCPQVLAGKGGKKKQYNTKMWWQGLTKDIQKVRYLTLFLPQFLLTCSSLRYARNLIMVSATEALLMVKDN